MESGKFAVGLLLFSAAACVDPKLDPCAANPDSESCLVAQKGNPCRKDADCGDGVCLAGGTCQVRQTSTQPTACVGVTCKSTEFCSNGVCLPATPQCNQADPACIYIPHGSFEPPEHAWWWPFKTAGGPEDASYDAAAPFFAALQYPDFTQVMSTPVVMRLHPADTEPAVVFNSFSPNQGYVVESQGVLRAVRGSDGSPIWSAPKDQAGHPEQSIDGNASIAAGDCMGNGEVCFITGGWDPNDVNRTDSNLSHQHGGLIAFGSDGRFLWVNRKPQVWWGAPAIARMLGPTGPAQIVVGNGVYDGATGAELCPQTTVPLDQVGGNGDGTETAIADIDLDGKPEIITGNQAYRLIADSSSATGYTCRPMFGEGVRTPIKPTRPGGCPYGSIMSATPGRGVVCVCPEGYEDICPDGFPAVASFAGYGKLMGLDPADPHPQVVVVSRGFLRIHDWTGGMLLDPIPLPPDLTCGDANQGGSPTIADFDGDGLPEVGIAAQGAYLVWKPGRSADGSPNFIWNTKTRDCSSNTGSSVFDFEGKGQANVVYGDQCYLNIYDGKTGKALIREKNSSCTAYENPIVADIDGSGRAKILVPNNTICDYECPDWPGSGGVCATNADCPKDNTCTANRCVGHQAKSGYVGLKALRSPTDKWVNTRSVWNEHTYHVSNVNLDGTLPFPEVNSWDKSQSNSYRQNVQGRGVFSAPDLSICEVDVDLTQCRAGTATVAAIVYNGGALVAKAGLSVTFYAMLPDGQSALLGKTTTKAQLQPGGSEKVTIPWVAPPQSQAVTVKAVVDEKQLVGDCHPENNVALSAPVKCAPLG